ncbi:FtsX-like permease family protein [Halobaculum magnesiiphilum]|uniref:ABC transporter permease n=1 Tax=Halobaculum magnesiiphilum TaxID=1017351 RepID=A0A8T8WEE9_9EURY|nr:FtsX-like permease family protein [Halobaculum magnesiiphilum]QZP38218.1 ABC transporter permease [Halobaculum magnesiiphilum]
MSYRRLLIGRWSRRDRLAILVVAVGVAFLCGTALLVVVAGDQTTAIAAGYDSDGAVTTHASVEAAAAAAPANATVIPFALANTPNGSDRYVLARPESPTAAPDLHTGSGTTLGTLDAPTTRTLQGPDGSTTVRVTPRGGASTVPEGWYVANASTVDRLGTSGAFVVHPVNSGEIPLSGVPLRTALAFFVLGTREALTALGVVVAGGAVLIGVVVHSVTRMTVRDRRATIRVIRATGARPATILALFGVRATLLSAAGAALGYAAGVIGVNAAVSVAVFAGLPTSLSPTLTPAAARVIIPILGAVVALGGVSGVLAAVPAVRGSPLADGRDAHPHTTGTSRLARLRSVAEPTVLDVRTAVPTAATLAAFVAFVVLVGSMAGIVAPLSGGEGATITEPGAVHPIASTVPTTYAAALRDRGIDASPELLLFEVDDGRTYTVRGAEYGAFASVTDESLVDGRRPATADEAVIGADLARTMDVGIGDRMTLGGPTRPGLARVEVVGVFTAPGPFDDQLIVPLSTARGLAGKPPGTAQFVRAERLPDDGVDARSTRITAIRAPDSAAPNSTVEATVVVENRREERTTATVPITVGNRTVEREVTLDPGGEATIPVAVETGPPGTIDISAGEITRTIRVGDATSGGLTLGPLPERGPPNATLSVRVRDADGDPVANATVTAGEDTATTTDAGIAQLSTGDPGDLTIRARAGNRTGEAAMRVAADAPRRPTASLAVRPESPDLLTRATVTATLSNPWGDPVEDVSVAVAGPDGRTERTVSLASGATREIGVRLPRQPPGTYEATLQVDGETVAVESFRVTGDERVAAALATGGRAGTSGIGRAVETAFGNLRLVFGTVLALAAGLTVGGTTATFSRAVHGRRETIGIHRATGASPSRVFRIVLGDALRIGVLAALVAVPVGVAGLRIAGALGYLTVFGVRIQATGSPGLLAAAALAGLSVTLAGAGLATASLLARPPARLVRDEPATGPPTEGSDE